MTRYLHPDILPFAVWMLLMFALPATPWSYALRTLLTALALIILHSPIFSFPQSHNPTISQSHNLTISQFLYGVLIGLLVLFLWVAPERFAFYREYLMFGGTANAAVDTSAWYWKLIRLLGSAFVISVAEELFFRRWLLRYAGFLWMVALFALEHNRWFAAAICGVLYGYLALRKGLFSAIIAHITTNLTLGLYVLATGHWEFW